MQEHKIWLAWAENDLRIARILLHAEGGIVSGTLYHCQQCIEKVLKAYLSSKNQPILKTHDLIKLLKSCSSFDEELLTLSSISIDLDPHITFSRYPDTSFIMPDLTTATILFKQTEEAFNFVKNKMQ